MNNDNNYDNDNIISNMRRLNASADHSDITCSDVFDPNDSFDNVVITLLDEENSSKTMNKSKNIPPINIENKIRILVIGYFNHNNIGDEQYRITFNYIFYNFLDDYNSYIIVFIDCDELKNFITYNNDIIILGGGDVLNDYFLDPLISKFKNKPNKIIAVSVGLPYSTILIHTHKLNILDFIFLRTKQDMELFSIYFFPERLFYIPDFSIFLIYLQDMMIEKKTSIYDKIKNNSFVKYFSNNIESPKIKDNIKLKRLEYINQENLKNNVIKQNNFESKNENKNFNNIVIKLTEFKKKNKIICFCLNRHIYKKNSIKGYIDILDSFYQCIVDLIKQNYIIVLLPFNTANFFDASDNSENDTIFHNDIYNMIDKISPILCSFIINIEIRLSIQQTFSLFDFFHMCIPMRFHACLFSIYKNIPIVPVFTTKKIKNLLLDIDWNYFYELNTNYCGIPYNMDSEFLLEKINDVNTNYSSCIKFLKNATDTFNSVSCTDIFTFIDTIKLDYKKVNYTQYPNYSENKIKNLIAKLNEFSKYDFRSETNENKKEIMINIISYYLTNNIDSAYNYGLKTKMFNMKYNYKSEWEWIIKDHHTKTPLLISNNNGLFNINIFDQNDYSNSHRFGWQYVYKNIKYLHNKDSELLLDLYIDRTFHWKNEIFKNIGIIPYKQKWIGFIHHTFDTDFSNYNNIELLKNKEFIESLPYCKGLIVLSKILKTLLAKALNIIGFNIPIFHLIHPTGMKKIPPFSFSNFLNNKDKKLLFIGGWLRDIFSFYYLILPLSKYSARFFTPLKQGNLQTYKLRKIAIKGKNMNNYYPIDEFNDYYEIFLKAIASKNNDFVFKNCSHAHDELDQEKIKNNWYKKSYEFNVDLIKSVDIMNDLNNTEYDNLLTENIVFINLVDASAVNTLIECIVRNTPIIINRHPAVVELLGEKYPLYYGDEYGCGNYFEINTQVNKLLSNLKHIEAAHNYLKNMDKTKFSIEYFTNNLINIVKNCNKIVGKPTVSYLESSQIEL